MKLGTTDISTIKLGSTDISKAYLGSSVVYEESTTEYTGFYVEDISGSDNTVTIKKYNTSAPTLTIEKSLNGKTWTSMGSTSTTGVTATVPANGKLYLRCNTDTWAYTTNYSYYNYINCSARHNVGGNIMSLLYGSSFTGEETTFPSGSERTFYYLFNNATTLVSAENLLLPATTLVAYCYSALFYGCKSLTIAPELPATSLAERCYSSLFSGCTSLASVPYNLLPATTLAPNCYQSLFSGCTSLTTAPELPATTLANACYTYLFNKCSSLTYIKVAFTNWKFTASDTDATKVWTNLTVNTTGTFVCPAALPQYFNKSGNSSYHNSSISGGNNAIPYGWAVQTY